MQDLNRWTSRLVLVALVLAVGASTAQAQSGKIGIFDPQRVSEETQSGKQVQAELESLRDTKQREISRQEAQINELQQQLQQQALSLSADKRTTMQINIQRSLLELNNAQELATKQLQLELAAKEAQFNERLRLVIEQVGRTEQFAMILASDVIAWYAPTVDVTTVVIDAFDRMFPAPAGS